MDRCRTHRGDLDLLCHVKQHALAHCGRLEPLARLEGETLGRAGVHGTRVAAKRLRALWQLLRPSIAGDRARRADDRLKQLNRSLSGARDRAVMIQTLEKLARTAACPEEAEALAAARSALGVDGPCADRVGTASVAAVDPAALILRERGDWLTVVPRSKPRKTVLRGLRRTYRRGRREARRAFRTGDAEAYHRWRKWVKHLLYQLEALGGLVHPAEGALLEALDKLGDRLGRLHDLDVLRGHLRTLELTDDQLGTVDGVIDRRACRLRERCRRGFEIVYERSPSRFATGMGQRIDRAARP